MLIEKYWQFWRASIPHPWGPVAHRQRTCHCHCHSAISVPAAFVAEGHILICYQDNCNLTQQRWKLLTSPKRDRRHTVSAMCIANQPNDQIKWCTIFGAKSGRSSVFVNEALSVESLVATWPLSSVLHSLKWEKKRSSHNRNSFLNIGGFMLPYCWAVWFHFAFSMHS